MTIRDESMCGGCCRDVMNGGFGAAQSLAGLIDHLNDIVARGSDQRCVAITVVHSRIDSDVFVGSDLLRAHSKELDAKLMSMQDTQSGVAALTATLFPPSLRPQAWTQLMQR